MRTLYHTTRAEFQRSGRKGSATQRATVLVDGRYFTYTALGELLGVPSEEASRRYKNLRRRSIWPITMEHLEGK